MGVMKLKKLLKSSNLKSERRNFLMYNFIYNSTVSHEQSKGVPFFFYKYNR